MFGGKKSLIVSETHHDCTVWATPEAPVFAKIERETVEVRSPRGDLHSVEFHGAYIVADFKNRVGFIALGHSQHLSDDEKKLLPELVEALKNGTVA